MSDNTRLSKGLAKMTSSAKNIGGKMNSLINTKNALDGVKNGNTGGERLMGIMNILGNTTKSK